MCAIANPGKKANIKFYKHVMKWEVKDKFSNYKLYNIY